MQAPSSEKSQRFSFDRKGGISGLRVETTSMHNAEEIAENAEEIAEAAAEIAEDVTEEVAEEAAGDDPPADTGGIAEAIHDVSLEERLSDCLQRLAVLESLLPRVEQQVEEAEAQAEQAEAVAETAIEIAVSANQESEVSEPEPVEIPPPPPVQEERKVSFWEALLGGR